MNISDETKAELRRRDDLLRQAAVEFVAKDEAGADCPFDVWKRAQAKMADAADSLGAYAVTHMTALLDALAAAEDDNFKLTVEIDMLLEALSSLVAACGARVGSFDADELNAYVTACKLVPASALGDAP